MGIKTLEEAMEVVKQDGRTLIFVPRALKTEEVCLVAVKQTAGHLRWCP